MIIVYVWLALGVLVGIINTILGKFCKIEIHGKLVVLTTIPLAIVIMAVALVYETIMKGISSVPDFINHDIRNVAWTAKSVLTHDKWLHVKRLKG